LNIQSDTELVIKAKAIFEHALSLPVDEQNSYLKKQCQGDDTLLQECLALFENWCDDNTFLKNLHPNDAQRKQAISFVGENFGVYRLNKKLGSGGMAEVYAATRTDGVHDKTVALKLLRGWGNAEQLISRFNQERKILAGLTHPNIARFVISSFRL
jgi:serine/threonine protein kinase